MASVPAPVGSIRAVLDQAGDVVDFFLEPSERFTDPFTDLWKLPRPENDQDNDEDNNQFRDPHGTKHGVVPSPWFALSHWALPV